MNIVIYALAVIGAITLCVISFLVYKIKTAKPDWEMHVSDIQSEEERDINIQIDVMPDANKKD